MSDSNEIFQAIQAVIEKNDDLKNALKGRALSRDSRFREDLGFDSLVLMSLAVELMELYPRIEETSIAKWKTVSDCIEDILVSESS